MRKTFENLTTINPNLPTIKQIRRKVFSRLAIPKVTSTTKDKSFVSSKFSLPLMKEIQLKKRVQVTVNCQNILVPLEVSKPVEKE
jgi:hypothetical protein